MRPTEPPLSRHRTPRQSHRRAIFAWAASALLLPLIVTVLPAATSRPAKEARVDFNRDIRPILSANCYACHGQDPAARQAKLRLDLRAEAVGRAIQPGKPEKSPLVQRINTANPALLMPPPSSNHHLTPAQKRLLTEWVRQGAPYAEHWAFVKPIRPSVPAIQNPKSKIQNPIDSFVFARLQRAGLSPAPEADRHMLIRRVSLDLTGLPPTPQEVDTFANDRSPDAYEKVVDRLLASSRYGEHWARMWLDLARYADTQGYEKDQPRTIWRYRDWVIDALNADMPYDRFTIEQLAGDLLPNATDSQILATAFHRNTMTNTEGGVDPEEFRTTAVKDRVDTTVQVWMGLTMGCAKCHSHKYDPLTLNDYYRFYALFNQTEDANRGDEFPTAPMPTEEQKRRQAALDEKLKGAREAFWKDMPGLKEQQAAWEKSLSASGLWTVLRYETAVAESGAELKHRADGAVLVSGNHAEKDTYTLTYRLPAQAVRSLRLEALKDPSLPNGGPGRDKLDQNVVTSEFVVEASGDGGKTWAPVALQSPRADFEQQGWKIPAAIDGNPDTGWAWAPQNGQPHVAVFDLKAPVTGGLLRVTLKQNYTRLQHGCFRVSVSGGDSALLKAELRPISEIAAKETRAPEEQRQLDEAFRKTHEPTAAIYQELSTLEKQKAALEGEVPRIPILRDLPQGKERVTKIHRRGNFLDPGDTVTPAVPAAFGAMPAGAPANRLGAAMWLVSKENPLTARVAVNRIWARLFGVGLVETEEDFGTQGTPPTHPELLDWLAVEFMTGGEQSAGDPAIQNPKSKIQNQPWSLKRLLKLIVMSATYRQSSKVTALKRKVDPVNTLLSRGPRFRLPAEVVRDQALAVSGLLSEKMHGPSVMPPQPDGIWKTVYSGLKWSTSPGEDRYRRGLYTFWRRTSPYPAMTTFDAGSGEFCVVRRVRTNTPLQALVTLNDPAFVEAAGALGKWMSKSERDLQNPVKVSIHVGFERVLARYPSPKEQASLERLFQQALAEFRQRPGSAEELLKAANVAPDQDQPAERLAAYTTVANVLLNLDETLTKP